MTLNRANGPLIAFLLLSLTACASRPISDAPPDSLLIDTPVPVAEGRTHSDLINWSAALRCAIIQANADKAALRAWKSGAPYTQSAASCDISGD